MRVLTAYKNNTVCDSRCWNAKTTTCKCSCVGQRHGMEHGISWDRIDLPSPIKTEAKNGFPVQHVVVYLGLFIAFLIVRGQLYPQAIVIMAIILYSMMIMQQPKKKGKRK